MRIAISGASGLVGSALVPALETAGHEVIRLVRRRTESSAELEWDPAAGRLATEALAGVDAIVNLSGATIGRRWTARRKREILDSRVGATSLLASTAAALEPCPSVLLCASGVGIYGDCGDEIVTEESETGGGFLAEVGIAWEAAANPARKAGIRVVNFRHGLVLSREGGALARMLIPFKLGLGGRIGSGTQWWSWVEIDDLVGAYQFALKSEIDGPVNLVSPNPATNAQLTRALGKAVRRPTLVPFPAVAARTIFGEMADEALLAGQRALPARLLEAGFAFRYPELDAALKRALEK